MELGQPLDLTATKIAARQHRVIKHEQLVDLGIGRNAIRRRLESGRLFPLYRGVYGVGPPPFVGRSAFIAAVYACGPGALLSHVSAAVLWGLLNRSSSWIHVSVPGRSRHRRGGIKLHLPRSIHPEDRAVRENIPVTSIARTLLDLAAILPYRQLVRAVEEAERLRLFDLGAVERLLARSHGRRGVRALKAAIAESVQDVPWTRSDLEREFLRLCRTEGLPKPGVNLWVEGYEVDAVWLEQRVAVELDSRAFHLTPAAFERDRERDIKLQVAGYKVIRVTQRRIERARAELVADLRALLGLVVPRTRAAPANPVRP